MILPAGFKTQNWYTRTKGMTKFAKEDEITGVHGTVNK